jgi:hypothetical protein
MNSREDYVQALDIKAVCGSIALRNPYFAFLDLERKSDIGVRGTFAAEHRTGHERGPVAAAELVRHLATLGSCAAVVNGASAPAYYLGTKGRLKLLRNPQDRAQGGIFLAVSEVLGQDRKSLVAQSVASGEDFLAHFHCEYQVLPEPVFARTFKHYRTEPVQDPGSSPYKEPIELDFEQPQQLSLKRTAGRCRVAGSPGTSPNTRPGPPRSMPRPSRASRAGCCTTCWTAKSTTASFGWMSTRCG